MFNFMYTAASLLRKSSIFSPHILIYKPQINSVFSVFLRFILIVFFLDSFVSSLNLIFLNSLLQILFAYFIDFLFLTEFFVVFYILSTLGEEFIDYDVINLNYWDIDLVIFFRFFFTFSLLFIAILLWYLILQPLFWVNLVFY